MKGYFIWIGTGHGLARYDGNHFRTFQKNESENSLPSNEISCLLADGDFIWVGTWNGLCKINTTTYQVTRIDLGKNKTVRTISGGEGNVLWIGTESGLIEYQKDKDSISNIYNSSKDGLSHNAVRSIYQDKSGTLWVGTYDKLNKLKKGNKQFDVFDLKGPYKATLKNNLICGDIKPFSEMVDSLLWIGTETGLCLFNTTSGTYQRFGTSSPAFNNEVIKCMYPDDDGNLWLGTDFGLNIFDPIKKNSEAYFHNPQTSYSIANNAIWQIFEDTGGVIWLVTSNGLSRLNKHRNFFEYHEVSSRIENQMVGNQVKAVLTTKKGIVWLATLHGAIRIDENNQQQIFNVTATEPKRILLDNSYALEEDNLGRIWIGTAGGINIWDESKRKMYSITVNSTNGLVTNYIAKFIKGTDGSLWVSTYQGGLFKVTGDFEDINSLRFKLVSEEFGSEKVVAGHGALWFSMNNELYRVNEESTAVRKIDGFNDQTKKDIHCLYFSNSGILWAGTQNGLLEYYPKLNKTEFRPIVTGRDVNIGNIAEDNEGNIWGATNFFIFKYNTATNETEMFPLDKDLPLKSFYYGCSAKSLAGEIIFGGDNGYVTFQSTGLKPSQYQPKVYVTALEINNKAVLNDEEINGEVVLDNDIAFTPALVLDYAHRSITFEFSALHFWQPALNVYAYKLDGFDTDWNYVSGQKNFAVYSNLSPKQYTLRVRGTNNYGVWSHAEATAIIHIEPPLLLSGWFIFLYAIVAISIVIIASRIYLIRLHLKNELKIVKLENEHIEELSKTKQQFFTNISHELRTPISLILPPIHQILKQGNLDQENLKLITLAEKNSQRLLRVINQILDFRKLENDTLQVKVTSTELVSFCQEIHALFTDKANRKKIAFAFTTLEKELKIWMDVEKIETVLFNLLSNAFKFTNKGGEISMSVNQLPKNNNYPEGIAEIKISDTGIGIGPYDMPKIFEPFYQTLESKQMEIGTGIGLALAAEYIKLHHGEIKVQSAKGKGSVFTVLLPLGNSHFPVDTIQEDGEINLLAIKEPITEAGDSRKPYRFDLESDKPLVLIIDDSEDMVEFIRVSLHHKYNFISAENGEEGLAKANNFLPEIMVSDIMMPMMDGLALCKKIKENPRTRPISIILVTAKVLTSQKIEGIRTGADVYITKPFEIEFLEANIDHLIERKKELAYYLKNELITQPPETDSTENSDGKFIKKVMNIIEVNIANPDFSVDVLSDEIGMSTSQLYRRLKSLTQTSANDIIKKYQLKKASLLLKNKEDNISEIMYDVGFTNVSYFSKCFKSEFGLSPKEYQQKMTNGRIDLSLDMELN